MIHTYTFITSEELKVATVATSATVPASSPLREAELEEKVKKQVFYTIIRMLWSTTSNLIFKAAELAKLREAAIAMQPPSDHAVGIQKTTSQDSIISDTDSLLVNQMLEGMQAVNKQLKVKKRERWQMSVCLPFLSLLYEYSNG